MKRKSKELFDEAMELSPSSRAALGERLILSAYDFGNLKKIAKKLEELSDTDPRPDIPAEEVLKEARRKHP